MSINKEKDIENICLEEASVVDILLVVLSKSNEYNGHLQNIIESILCQEEGSFDE